MWNRRRRRRRRSAAPRTASPACSRARRRSRSRTCESRSRPGPGRAPAPARGRRACSRTRASRRNSTRVDELGLLLAQALAHRAEPAQVGEALLDRGEARLRRRRVGDRGRRAPSAPHRPAAPRPARRRGPARGHAERQRSAEQAPRHDGAAALSRCGRARRVMPRACPSGRQARRRAARSLAAASRRPWYSTLPSFRPRSDRTTRCGTPISSQSANIAPGRSPRSSRMTSTPALEQLGVQRVGGLAHRRRAVVADRADHDRERRDRVAARSCRARRGSARWRRRAMRVMPMP